MADPSIGQQAAAQLPSGSNLTLFSRPDSPEDRFWYARQAIENGWSCGVLAMQIDAHLVDRAGKAVNDFEQSFPPADSDMAIRVFKDPYLFDFLGTEILQREPEVELKAYEFKPSFIGQLDLYRNAADDLLRKEYDGRVIGLLLVHGKSSTVVRYVSGGFGAPSMSSTGRQARR